jgi:hypothetical protein
VSAQLAASQEGLSSISKSVFSDVTSCGQVERYQGLRGIWCPHLQGIRIYSTSKRHRESSSETKGTTNQITRHQINKDHNLNWKTIVFSNLKYIYMCDGKTSYVMYI